MLRPNHQDNIGTNLTSPTSASDTTSPLDAVPSIAAPFWIAFDATNINGHYERKLVTSKTATNVLHSALAYDHTVAEEVRLVNPAEEFDAIYQPPQGYLINGKISVTDTGSGLNVALKTIDGNDPSETDPVFCRIGNGVYTISSALSVTKADGTNWCNAGSAELATKEIDYFVYLGYNATDGVVIGFSRYPEASSYDDFSATTTNEKYCAISTITNAAATDYYEVIGRFAATLSGGAGYTWSVPTFTAKNLKQRPIYETRSLLATMTLTGLSSTLQASIAYKISGSNITLFGVSPGYIGGISNATGFTATLPFSSGATTYFEGVPLRVQDNGADQTGAGLAKIAASSATMTLYKTLLQGTWTATNGKYFYMLPITYEI